jgi:non-ribosomal peptide synthase protein (TIGR01720 family)
MIREVKEQLRRVPQNGLGYGVLRYLGDETVRETLSAQSRPQILFAYLGQMDQAAAVDGPFAPIAMPIGAGAAYGQENQRAHLLDVNARVVDGRLEIHWQYPTLLIEKARIEALAEGYLHPSCSG